MRSIAIAEGISTGVALGSVLIMQHCNATFEPLYKAVADSALYPLIAPKHKVSAEEENTLHTKAHDEASMFVKGAVMVGVGIATHIPLQLAMTKSFSGKDFKLALLGKSAGLAVSLGSLYMLGQACPKISETMDKKACESLAHYMPQGDDGGCRSAKELYKLVLMDVPSSLISGAINYQVTRSHF